MIEARSPEAIREFLVSLRPVYRDRLFDRIGLTFVLGVAVYQIGQLAFRRAPRVPNDTVSLLIVALCAVTVVAAVIVCCVFATGSLRHQHERLTYSAFPWIFDWTIPDESIETLRFVPMIGQYVLKVQERGSKRFRMALITGDLSRHIERFVSGAEPARRGNAVDAPRKS